MTRVFAALACMGMVFSIMLPDMLCWRKRPSYVTEQYIVRFDVQRRNLHRSGLKVDIILFVTFNVN
jgi:hypothetical protein